MAILRGFYRPIGGLFYVYSLTDTSWNDAAFTAAWVTLYRYPVVSAVVFAWICVTVYGLYNLYMGVMLRLNKPYVVMFKVLLGTMLVLMLVSLAIYTFSSVAYCMDPNTVPAEEFEAAKRTIETLQTENEKLQNENAQLKQSFWHKLKCRCFGPNSA